MVTLAANSLAVTSSFAWFVFIGICWKMSSYLQMLILEAIGSNWWSIRIHPYSHWQSNVAWSWWEWKSSQQLRSTQRSVWTARFASLHSIRLRPKVEGRALRIGKRSGSNAPSSPNMCRPTPRKVTCLGIIILIWFSQITDWLESI